MTRVLSLDDEPQMVDLIRLVLESAGYEVVGATEGQEALDILRTQSIDLLLQDFMRPGELHGFELLRQMKSDPALSRIPVLGVSAGTIDTRSEQLKQFGLDIDRDLVDYVRKPFGPQELLEAVADALRRPGKDTEDG